MMPLLKKSSRPNWQLALVFFAALLTLTAADAVRPTIADPDVAAQIVDAFQALFGKHSGFRPVHAKGVVCEGDFTPAPSAALLTRAAHLQRNSLPVIVRFSNFAGLPTISDTGSMAGPRGMAIKFMLPDGTDTDIVSHSYNGFPVATPGDFLAFLKALAAEDGHAAPGTSELDRFKAEHPRAREFLDDPMPAPLSYGTENFYGVDAFRFTNAEGESRFGRYIIRPVAAEAHLGPVEAAARAPDFLAQELSQRLKRGPVEFRLLVQLAEKGDSIQDASARWPQSRTVVELGTLSLRTFVVDSSAMQRDLFFTPMNVLPGIATSEDPLLAARTRSYSQSYERRHR